MAFQIEAVIGENLRHDHGRADLVDEHLPVESLIMPGFGFRLDEAHGCFGGHHSGPGESVEQSRRAEEVVEVAMRDVDGGEFLAAGFDPVCQLARILHRGHRVDENGVTLARDQRRCRRRPGPASLRRRHRERDVHRTRRHGEDAQGRFAGHVFFAPIGFEVMSSGCTTWPGVWWCCWVIGDGAALYGWGGA
ncbi:hypothetical protein [Streptomyces sp. SPB162]|uniref:hypothetical protein n=1 Tax=Streptomyces sp. SPB162 TaxID=2940560 RepID=UPI002404B4F3|nr:hypothetical protein [Streptomyces sp. SPB162]